MKKLEKIQIIQTLIKENENSPYAWSLLGMEYTEKNMVSESIYAFSKALKFCDDNMREFVMKKISELSSAGQNNSDIKEKTMNEDILDKNPIKETVDNDKRNLNEKKENVVQLSVVKGRKNLNTTDLEKLDSGCLVTFEDVGGLEKLKETIKLRIIKPFINPEIFNMFRKKIGGGILLFGPPGCGKTFIAKATAGECEASFMPIHITDILSPYLGESSQNIKHIFNTARAKKPCVIFIDEIDTIGYNRSKLTSEHLRPIIDQLLSEIDGVENDSDKLLIIGATNMPWDVDSALKRPGRFDKIVFIPPPDKEAREIIFKLKMQDRPADNIDYAYLAKNTELYSGADIENVVELATENVISEIIKTGTERKINMNDLLIAIQETKPSTIEWFKTIRNYIKYANQSKIYDDVEKYLKNHKKLFNL